MFLSNIKVSSNKQSGFIITYETNNIYIFILFALALHADIHIDDTNLLSILMLAYSQGKSLKIEVNSTRKIIDEVCVVTALCM